MGRHKKKRPGPAPVEQPIEPSSAAPSSYQRSANKEAARRAKELRLQPYELGKARELDRRSLLRVERGLLSYFEASIDFASLKPSEAATLARAFALVLESRRKLEHVDDDAAGRKELRAAQLERLGRTPTSSSGPPELLDEDPDELAPERIGEPSGFG